LKNLTVNEMTVLVYHYGLFGVEKKSFNEIALDIKLTRERARQLEASALVKMRTSELRQWVKKLPPSELLGAIMGYCDCGCIYNKDIKLWRVGDGIVCNDCLEKKIAA